MALPTIDQVAAVLARAPAGQPWRNEGPVRHLIRQALCRAGWKWWAADRKAFALVARGRIKNGVRQPAGWDSNDASVWIGTLECAICGRATVQKKIGQMYCSDACAARGRRIGLGLDRFTRCERCGRSIEEPAPGQKYCTRLCGEASARERNQDIRNERRRLARARAREERGLPPAPQSIAARGNGYAKPNGHAKPKNGHCHENDHGPAAEARPNGAGDRERGAQDRAGARGGEAGAPRLDAAAAAAGGAAALCGSDGRGD